MRFILLLLSLLLYFPGNGATAREQWLPVTLRVLNYDEKLAAFLLAGDYQNNLRKPLRGWRGELRLHSSDGGQSASFLLEQQARRPVLPNEWGVWSIWIDFKPEQPSHQVLKTMQPDKLEVELRLLRILYADGEQHAF